MYYLLFSVGALSFLLATLCTLPYLDEQRSLPLFHFLLRFAAVCMAVAEILELGVNPVPKWRPLLCFIAVLGNILYVCSTYIYEMFNKGELYLMAAFCVSASAELKILSIILKDGWLFSTLLKLEKNRLARFGFLTGGAIFFLAGSVILLLQSEQKISLAAGLTNSLGGIIYSISIYTMFRKDEPIGYEVFDQSIEVPTIL